MNFDVGKLDVGERPGLVEISVNARSAALLVSRE
jgi:hypothetical protein